MHLCEKCKAELAEPGSESRFPFPSSTVAGGALGAIGAVVTGTVILVPLGMLAGAALDAGQCDGCGEPVEEADPRYAMMEAGEEDGEPIFTPFQPSRNRDQADEGFYANRAFETPVSTPCREDEWEVPLPPDTCDAEGRMTSEHDQVRYRYDEITGQLVPIDEPETEEIPITKYTFSVGPESDSTDRQFMWPEVTPEVLPEPGPELDGTQPLSRPADTGEPESRSEGGKET